jgi:glycine/D-amino acid oxidase-like deaminating enzyme
MILICGAGVGGLWAAHELLHAGVPADKIRILEAARTLDPALGGSFAIALFARKGFFRPSKAPRDTPMQAKELPVHEFRWRLPVRMHGGDGC